MDRNLKSMMYAFRAEDIDIYRAEKEDSFIASHLVCKKCNSFWFTDLAECFICGEINYNLSVCPKDHYNSQQGSSKACKICKKEIPKLCMNSQCASNTNKELQNILDKLAKNDGKGLSKGKTGVFERKESSFRTSQLHCLNCGSTANIYKNFHVFVRNFTTVQNARQEILSHCSDDVIVIFKQKTQRSKGHPPVLEYSYSDAAAVPNNWTPKWNSDLSKIIDVIFS